MTALRNSKYRHLAWLLPIVAVIALLAFGPPNASATVQQDPGLALVKEGRQSVITHDCSGCHGGVDPSMPGWLDGVRSPVQIFLIGPCADPKTPNAQPCFHTYPRNLTPDNATGIGRFTERQIFNALRFGLRPEDTPDTEITGMTPGKGNFPANPHYLAVPMPWPAWRHLPDHELRAIAAYLKRGLKPSVNKVPDSEGPPDFWADSYTADKIGTLKSPAFPTAYEQKPK